LQPRREKNETVLKARALRRNMTLPEGLLWLELRKRPGGMKFRRQHPLGPYILDFHCPAASLAIEVDGESHNRGMQPQHDVRRDEWLLRQGIDVVRFSAVEVINNLDAVVREITRLAAERLPLHHPRLRVDGSPPHGSAVGRN
jgi:very-short-patch-repair endonuclease